MVRAIGIDPGTVSFDVCGLEDGQVFLDTTVPSAEFAANPQALIDLLQSARPVDLIVGPSGYGLPLVRIEEFGAEERFLFTLVDERERERIPVLGGMGKMIMTQFTKIKVPGVIVYCGERHEGIPDDCLVFECSVEQLFQHLQRKY